MFKKGIFNLGGLGDKRIKVGGQGLQSIKKSLEDIQDKGLVDDFDNSFYAFISLNKGSGAKTTATHIAYELSKRYRVCLLDCNLLQPGTGVLLNTPVTKDMSVMGYFNSNKEIIDVFIEPEGMENLWLISASPVDNPLGIATISEESYDQLVDYVKRTFDYVIAYVPYFPLGEWFVNTLKFIDKGYFVWDEQIDNVINTKVVLDYINKISDRANCVNNIILNKKTEMAYPYFKIEEIGCDLVVELPFIEDILMAKNEGRLYVKSSGVDKGYRDGLGVIIKDIKSGQFMNEGI